MATPDIFAGNLALDLMRAHLPEIERASTVVQARELLGDSIEQARQVYRQTTKQPDTAPLEQSIDELLARLVPLRRPRIDGRGGISDAGEPGSRSTAMVVLVAGLLIAALGVGALLLL